MQGIHHRVVEIHPQQNEWIESVWVVLKPGAGEIHLAQSKQEAERFANGLVCWKRRKNAWVWYVAVAVGAIAATATMVLWAI